jgi:hypothetical protein
MTKIRLRPAQRVPACLLTICLWGLWNTCSPALGQIAPISGLTWADEHTLLAVHDAKNPSENNKPRISMITVPKTGEQFHIDYVNVEWPAPGGHSSDLEAVAAVPGTPLIIAAESGQDFGKRKRLFVFKYDHHKLHLVSHGDWPADVKNVEGVAITKLGGKLYFFYAERGDGKTTTQLRWAELSLDPLKLGSFSEATISRPEPSGANTRTVSEIAFDPDGRIYIAGTYDPGDNGPFNSVVWRVGQVSCEGDQAKVTMTGEPELIGKFPGTKVEGIAIHALGGGKLEMFLGSDDEAKGGLLKRVPIEK